VLAEAMGMNVQFFDILQIMPLGCATPRDSLEDLLRDADFVTLHVPSTPDTHEMIGPNEIAAMKKGSYLINASRGNVVRLVSVPGEC
jgi:D-3-phosphoglycerate dehydrogenase